jgi:hypothetical protein
MERGWGTGQGEQERQSYFEFAPAVLSLQVCPELSVRVICISIDLPQHAYPPLSKPQDYV